MTSSTITMISKCFLLLLTPSTEREKDEDERYQGDHPDQNMGQRYG